MSQNLVLDPSRCGGRGWLLSTGATARIISSKKRLNPMEYSGRTPPLHMGHPPYLENNFVNICFRSYFLFYVKKRVTFLLFLIIIYS